MKNPRPLVNKFRRYDPVFPRESRGLRTGEAFLRLAGAISGQWRQPVAAHSLGPSQKIAAPTGLK
jgi:hypothetical protein